MFPGLGHHAVVDGDDQERVLVRSDARDHVVYEAVVAGHVDEADAATAQVGVREP